MGIFIITFYLTISYILCGKYFDILSDILAGIYSAYVLTFSLTFFLAYLLPLFLAFYLIYLHSFIVAEVRLGSLSSSGCCSGTAGTTAISHLQLRSGRDHSDLLFRSSGDHCDHELAVEFRWRRRRPADIKYNNPHLTGEEKE